MGKLQFFFSVSNDECTVAHWGRVWDPGFSDKKCKDLCSRDKPNEKNRCLRLPRHTGHPQLKYGKASATTAWKTKSTRTPSLVSPYEKTGDSRFAPNLLPYTGVRAVFFGVTCAVVRKVYSILFPVVRLASCRFGRRHFEVHLALFWNPALLPPPFFLTVHNTPFASHLTHNLFFYFQ